MTPIEGMLVGLLFGMALAFGCIGFSEWMTTRSKPDSSEPDETLAEWLGRAMAEHSQDVGFGHSSDSCGPGCAEFVLARLSFPPEPYKHRRFIATDADPQHAYVQGHIDRYRRDREPDIACVHCGKPWSA